MQHTQQLCSEQELGVLGVLTEDQRNITLGKTLGENNRLRCRRVSLAKTGLTSLNRHRNSQSAHLCYAPTISLSATVPIMLGTLGYAMPLPVFVKGCLAIVFMRIGKSNCANDLSRRRPWRRSSKCSHSLQLKHWQRCQQSLKLTWTFFQSGSVSEVNKEANRRRKALKTVI